MSLRIFNGNVLDAKADAIILTVDGSAKGMEGNIARAFARRWPESWSELEDEIPYPLPLGEVFDYAPSSECAFRLILIASTLHHKDAFTGAFKKGVVKTALENAISLASGYGIKTIATALMSGGWRLSRSSAFMAMVEGYAAILQKGKDTSIDIYIQDNQHYESIKSLAHSIGIK